MTSDTYFLGHSEVRRLQPIAESANEREALQRLSECQGDEGDMRAAAAMFERIGDDTYAQELLRMILPIRALF
jgi:hypothetical protein